MANLSIRKSAALPTSQPEWSFDPFEGMRELLRWDPFAELARAQGATAVTFTPAFEVKETKEAYLFKGDLPGIKEGEVELSFSGNRLNIVGKREAEKKEQGETYYSYERSYGSFLRSFTLPNGADAEHARAELKDGVLTVVIPKSPAAQPRKISVNTEKTKS
jgi:HSP20 family protein